MELIQLKADTLENAKTYLNTYYRSVQVPSETTVKVFLLGGGIETLKMRSGYFHEDGTQATKDHMEKASIITGYADLWEHQDSIGQMPRFHEIVHYKDKPKTATCSICGEKKSIDNFYMCKEKHEKLMYGYSSSCKKCLVIEMDAFSRLFIDEC